MGGGGEKHSRHSPRKQEDKLGIMPVSELDRQAATFFTL